MCWGWELDVQFPRARAKSSAMFCVWARNPDAQFGCSPAIFWGGGNSCSCILGVQSHPPHSPPISPLGSMWRFRRKARSSACSDLTHHLHHPVLPDANNRGALPLRARKINHHAVPFLPANALEGKNARIGTLLVAGISLQESVTKAINALPCI